MENLLVRTPPQTGPRMPMRRMAMGMNLAILCCRSMAREIRAAGRWKMSEDTAAHRNTPYHISAGASSTRHLSHNAVRLQTSLGLRWLLARVCQRTVTIVTNDMQTVCEQALRNCFWYEQ